MLMATAGSLAIWVLIAPPAVWPRESSETKVEADFVVAPDGHDSNPGTQQQPFATLGRAQQVVREKIAAGLHQDIFVLLRGGEYFLDKPLNFGIEDSGTEKYAVTYAAFPGERPIIILISD